MCFFFKQKTAYEMRISDWSSDVCSSDLKAGEEQGDWRWSHGWELAKQAALFAIVETTERLSKAASTANISVPLAPGIPDGAAIARRTIVDDIDAFSEPDNPTSCSTFHTVSFEILNGMKSSGRSIYDQPSCSDDAHLRRVDPGRRQRSPPPSDRKSVS